MKQNAIFNIRTEREFKAQALRIFKLQYLNNEVYRSFCSYLNIDPDEVRTVAQIPFLPIEFFKSKTVVTSNDQPE